MKCDEEGFDSAGFPPSRIKPHRLITWEFLLLLHHRASWESDLLYVEYSSTDGL